MSRFSCGVKFWGVGKPKQFEITKRLFVNPEGMHSEDVWWKGFLLISWFVWSLCESVTAWMVSVNHNVTLLWIIKYIIKKGKLPRWIIFSVNVGLSLFKHHWPLKLEKMCYYCNYFSREWQNPGKLPDFIGLLSLVVSQASSLVGLKVAWRECDIACVPP